MYIAVCDDNPQDLSHIASILKQYEASCSVSLRFQLFSDAENMLKAARNERFTHYFLDVSMPSMDGITAAQEIRSFDNDAVLVFLTSFKEYAYQSYRVKARDYLLKPIQSDHLLSLLAQFQSQETALSECLCIQNGRSFFRIPFSQLSCLEINQKRLYFYLLDGQIRQIPGSMSEYEKTILFRREFLKIHRSYIVNLNHIVSLTPEGCVLFSGKNLPVSRLLYQQVQNSFMEHLFSREEGY